MVLWENYDTATGRDLNTDFFAISPALLNLDLREMGFTAKSPFMWCYRISRRVYMKTVEHW